MTLRLKAASAAAGIKQGELAAGCQLSRSALNGWLNHDRLPLGVDRADLERRAADVMRARGGETVELFTHESPPATSTDAPSSHPANSEEETAMLLRYVKVSAKARAHFNLPRDPFANPASIEDVYINGDFRYVRESMWSVVKHGGFMAVVGESGAGKSTLHDELMDRVQRETVPAIMISPYTLGMEDNDTKGKTLKAAHIAESIMSAVAPLETTKSSPEARFRQVHNALRDSSRAGQLHVIVIEEAHSLPIPTLKHLKRFIELKDGLRPLLSIILIGQPELMDKLSEADPNVREVVQRIEIVHLPPLNADLEGFLKHRLERVGVPLARVFDGAAIEALRTRLTPNNKQGTRGQGSLLYPKATQNVLSAAMNAAAELGLERVTADVVAGVRT